MTLQETIEQIHPLSKEAMDRAKAHWEGIAKPLHSLGKLEDVLIQIAGITGKEEISIEKRALLTFCADNGVVEENVTQSGQEVTATVAENFLQEKATAAILCRGAHADLFPIDIGMARDTKVPRYKVAYGTKNMAKGPAMTREEAVRALETGIAVAEEKIAAGYQLMATGEMGIRVKVLRGKLQRLKKRLPSISRIRPIPSMCWQRSAVLTLPAWRVSFLQGLHMAFRL